MRASSWMWMAMVVLGCGDQPDTAGLADSVAPTDATVDSGDTDLANDTATDSSIDTSVASDSDVTTDISVVDETNEPDGDPTDTSTVDAPSDTSLEDEVEVVAGCPGGCGHLDSACLRGVCVEDACTTEVRTGETCDDGRYCTVGDVCSASGCAGVARDCGSAPTCAEVACDENQDRCVVDDAQCECDADADCSVGATTCLARTCDVAAGLCADEAADARTPCAFAGGRLCDGMGACVECLADSDCVPGTCNSGRCHVNAIWFAALKAYATHGERIGALAVALLDGDAHADVVTTHHAVSGDPTNTWVSILRGKGDGTLLPFTQMPTNGAPFDVQVADVTSDGAIDLVATGYDKFVVLAGIGDGSFLAATATANPGATLTSLAIGQLDPGGAADLIVGKVSTSGSDLGVFSGVGDGHFVQSTSAIAETQSRVLLGPFLSGGKLAAAVISGSSTQQGVGLLRANGAGGFDALVANPVADPLYFMRAADLDGDGVLDVIATSQPTGKAWALVSNGVGGFRARSSFAVGENPQGVCIGDIDHDGRLDVAVVLGTPTNAVKVFRGRGDGTFTAPTGSWAAGPGADRCELVDLDHDDELDLVVSTSATVSVLLGSHRGCVTDGDCADSDLCNGSERCVASACVPGAPVQCEGSDTTCRSNICVGATGMCAIVDEVRGEPCSDHDGAQCDGDGACVECLSTAECGATDVCVDGACVACGAGLTRCGDMCVDLATDEGNCGACGYAVIGARSCVAGKPSPGWLTLSMTNAPTSSGWHAAWGGRHLTYTSRSAEGVNELRLYDPVNDSWTLDAAVPPLVLGGTPPCGGAGTSAIAVPSRHMVVWWDGRRMWLYVDDDAPHWEGPYENAGSSLPRYHYVLAQQGAKVYVVLGASACHTNGVYPMYSDILEFDLDARGFAVGASLAPDCNTGERRLFPGAAVANGVLALIGGFTENSSFCNTSSMARYDVGTRSWLAGQVALAPYQTFNEGTMLSVGTSIFVSGDQYNDRLAAWLIDPKATRTTVTPPPGGGDYRGLAFAMFTGRALFYWGGYRYRLPYEAVGTGAMAVVADGNVATWSALPTLNAPSPRFLMGTMLGAHETHSQYLWSGREAFVYAGKDVSDQLLGGSRYQPPVGCVCPRNADAPEWTDGCVGVSVPPAQYRLCAP